MSGKRPTDHLEPSAKKRTQDRQGRKGDEDEDDSEAEEQGEFAKASEEVLKQRRIIKARRAGGGLSSTQPAAAPANGAVSAEAPAAAPKSSNPFAGVSLLAQKPQVPATSGAPVPTEPPAVSAAPATSAKAELGSADAVVGTGGDANDEAASSPLGTTAANAMGATAEQPGNGGTAPAAEAAEADAGAKPEAHAPPADPPASAASAEGSSGMPPVSSAAQGAPATGGFSFGGNLAKSVGGFGGGGGSGFGALAGAASSSGGFAAFGSRPGTADADSGAGGLFGSQPAFAFGTPVTADATTPAKTVFGGAGTDAAQDKPSSGGKPAVLAAAEKVETGEEGERTVFAGDGTLFSFDTAGWRERGRGELRVKVDRLGQARLVMRQRGNLRLLLNANLWDDMAVNVMDGAMGVTFAVHNAVATPAAAGKDGSTKDGSTAAGTPAAAKEENPDAKLELTTFAFRVKAKQTLEEFKAAIELYKKADAAATNV